MPTFVEEVQSIESAEELGRRVADRIERLGEALALLERWTEESRDAQTELASKYDAAKTLARDEIRSETDGEGDTTSDEDVDGLPAEDLLDHPAVSERTKDRLREYSTKLFVYLDEENSYGEARAELIRALDAELGLYKQLLSGIETGETSVEDARARIARFAREGTLGPANWTAVDVLLDSTVDEEA